MTPADRGGGWRGVPRRSARGAAVGGKKGIQDRQLCAVQSNHTFLGQNMS